MSGQQDSNQPDSPQTEALEFDFSNPNAKPEVELHPDSLADGFLKDVDPNDRPYVERYVKDWDGRVTRKFQSIHEQYAPYKDLGDAEELRNIQYLASRFDTDPIGTLNTIVETYQRMGIDMSGFAYNGGNGSEEEEEYEEPSSEASTTWAPSQEEWDQMKQFMLGLGSSVLEDRKATQAEKDKKEFDGYLRELHDEHGDFDDEWVTNQIARNVDPVEAVKAFNQMIESRVNSRTNKLAPNIFGGGGTPGQVKDVDVSKLSKEDRRAYIAAQIARGNGMG